MSRATAPTSIELDPPSNPDTPSEMPYVLNLPELQQLQFTDISVAVVPRTQQPHHFLPFPQPQSKMATVALPFPQVITTAYLPTLSKPNAQIAYLVSQALSG